MIFDRRNRTLRLLCAVAAALAAALCEPADAQVPASAFGPGHSIWAGAEYLNYKASFPYQSNYRLTGYQFFANYNFTPNSGVEANVRLRNQNGFQGETESSYLIGPQFRSPRFGRFQFYGQVLVGLGHIQFPYSIGNGSYFAASPGGGVNYRLTRRWQIRGGYDFELWFDSPNVTGQPDDPISPGGFHAGIAFTPTGRRRP